MSAMLAILDVGHGNCSIFTDNSLVGIIDAGKGPYASMYLASKGITEVELIVISHADDDHLAGIIGLLSSEKIKVKTVALNADAKKDTKILEDVRALLESQHNEGKISVKVGLFSGSIREWTGKGVVLDVLSPSVSNALSGVGGKDQDGKLITANSGSVVIRLSHNSGNKALLAADMEVRTLDEMLSRGKNLEASILVFPHHGGKSGSSASDEFPSRLLSAVNPSTVLFSNGREKHDNPRPEILTSVCERKTPYIACTQLSKNCNSTIIKRKPNDLIYSAGADEGRSCAGTIEINLITGQQNSDRMTSHNSFVKSLEKPMCMALKDAMNWVQEPAASQHSAAEFGAATGQLQPEALRELRVENLFPEIGCQSSIDAIARPVKP